MTDTETETDAQTDDTANADTDAAEEEDNPFGTNTVTDELVKRLKNDTSDGWDQELLIESVAAEMDVSEIVVEDSLDHLLYEGKAYRVPTEDGRKIRRTPGGNDGL